MTLIEEMISEVACAVCGSYKITYQGTVLDLTPPWPRLTLKQALKQYGKVDEKAFSDMDAAASLAEEIGVEMNQDQSLAELLVAIFEKIVEPQLIQPTFITEYPVEVSPLARESDTEKGITDRFELFINGKELANGFSELNDPEDQAARFRRQAAQKGAAEDDLSVIDEAFLTALEYGMPPTAGAGIGIDRLVMILTDSPSIRDVIFFPQMREKT
jgi:lysyl-tRNA synthetase class 2